MRATAENIWRVPAYLPYLQPPLTDDAIASAEREIGYKLPEDFLNLLRTQNGGYIRFSLAEMPHDSIAGIGPHYPSLTAFDWYEVKDYVSFSLDGLVPFDGDGHWHLCLDYRGSSDAPVITYADVECDTEERVADSFAEYLTKLRLDVGDSYVLETVSDIERVKALLSERLDVNFDPPDAWAHGYPIERAKLGSEKNPQWLWISPNTVSRGFVRSDDLRYTELKDLMPGQSDRHLGLPADSYIMSFTQEVKSRVLDACSQARLPLRQLREYVAGS